MVRKEEVVEALEHADALISTLEGLDGIFKEEARIRLRRVAEIICMPDSKQEANAPEMPVLNDLLPEDADQIREQLTLVLEKVEELEKEAGICIDGNLWDRLYVEHGIRRKRVAQLVAKLTSDGLIRSVKPGYYKRIT